MVAVPLEQRAKMGRPPHTGRAFGYNTDGTVREDEAELVKSKAGW